MNKQYLGNGVHVEHEAGLGGVMLTSFRRDRIFLEWDVCVQLLEYIMRIQEKMEVSK